MARLSDDASNLMEPQTKQIKKLQDWSDIMADMSLKPLSS